MTSRVLLALSVTVRVAVPSPSPTVASAMLTDEIGVAGALAAGPGPAALRAHTSKVCSVPLASPVTVTLRAEAPPATVVESPNAPVPTLYRYPYSTGAPPEPGGSHVRVTSRSPAAADRFCGAPPSSSLSVIVTVAVAVPIVALAGPLSATVKVSASSSTSSSVIPIEISAEVVPAVTATVSFVTAV